MTAFQIDGQPKPILSFVKVLDKVDLGMEEPEDTIEPPADRPYWVKKASEEIVTIVDDCKSILKTISPNLDLKYNRYYIGITRADRLIISSYSDLRKHSCELGSILGGTK